VEQQDSEVSGLLVAAVAETVTNLVDTASQAKLQIDQVDLAPFGLLRAVALLTEPGESVAIIHLGAHTSYVIVAERGVPRFVRILALEITAAATVPEESELPPPAFPGQSMEERLLNYQLEYQSESMPQEKIDELVTQMVNPLRFYVDRSGGQSIDRVLLTGAGAGIPKVHAGFKQRIGVPVILLGGHHRLSKNQKKVQSARRSSAHGKEDLELLTLAGLAMSGQRR